MAAPLSMMLMVEASRRFTAPGVLRVLLDDACVQASYCIDAPAEVQDGVEWFQDEDIADCSGAVPRWIDVREDTP